MTRASARYAPLLSALSLLAGCSASDAGSSNNLAYNPSYLDETSDPCTDFFRYACGTSIDQHPADPGQTLARFYYGDGRESTYFWQLLQDMQSRDPNLTRERAYYSGCMGARTASTPLDDSLRTQLEQAASLSRIEDLPSVLANLQLAGAVALFRTATIIDPGDPSRYALALSGGGFSLPLAESYADATLSAAYQQHIASLAGLAQAAYGKSLALEAPAVFDFERAVAEATSDPHVLRDPIASYNPTSLASLSTALPGFGWNDYLMARGVGPIDQLIVEDDAVLPGLAKVLSATPVSVISQYLMWRVLEADSWATTKPLNDQEFAFHGQIVAGQVKAPPDAWACLSATRDVFGFQLAQHYVERFVSPELKPAVSRMVTQIREAMNANFTGAAWLDDETRQRAEDKLTQITANVAYPDQWPAAPTSNVSESAPFLTQVIAFQRDRAMRNARLVGQAATRDGFELSPDTTNATYSPEKNALTIPVAILQDPFYRADRPLTFNWGAIGSVIGHELTHGFDDEGRHYDGSGKLDDWWTEASSTEFERRTQCLADQYSSYEAAPGAAIDGTLTLGENVADLGGLKLAFAAFESNRSTASGSFTPEQELFLSYAQLHCSNQSPEAAALQVATDPHSPDAFRVNGVVRNLPEFAQAFSCAPGAPLSPVNRCEVW